jgi:predicted nuclease of predicted toxin-antitoxin system
MKFIIDAQLPQSLSNLIKSFGYDSVHTIELPDKNFTKDSIVTHISIIENRVIITKDSDFLDSQLLYNKPQKLIIVKTGNIKNNELLKIFENNFTRILLLLNHCSLLEITHTEIIEHK